VRIADSGGWTALHFAARELQLEIAKLLLDAGAPLDVKDEYGNTPLQRAILQREVFSSEAAPAMIELLKQRAIAVSRRTLRSTPARSRRHS
jgi:ankyrin repeat protein